MKYKVQHAHLIATDPKQEKPDKIFKRGDVVTAKQLTDAGFDMDHLTRNQAIEEMEGTKDDADDELPVQLTTTSDASPADGTAPLVDAPTPAEERKADADARRDAKKGR